MTDKLKVICLQSMLNGFANSKCGISFENWQRMIEWSKEHRFSPQLYKSTDAHSLPPKLHNLLKEEYQKHSKRSLMFMRELVLLNKAMKELGVPFVILKGPVLAFGYYDDPAFRPMRDIDILVKQDDALNVYQHLIKNGFSRIPKYNAKPESVIDKAKHLPPLLSIGQKTAIEVHTRVFSPKVSSKDFADDENFWKSLYTITVAGEHITCESLEYLLVHLVIHSVRDHLFNNGPLILSDVKAIIKQEQFDWAHFSQIAKKYGAVAECRLIFQLLQYLDSESLPDIPEEYLGGTNHNVLNSAINLLLADFESRSDRKLLSEVDEQRSVKDKVIWIMGKFFPDRKTLAMTTPVSANSPLIVLWYPIKWFKMISSRLPRMRKKNNSVDQLRSDAFDIGVINEWLRS